MKAAEDLIRSTTTAIAATVREVPPLRLAPAGDILEPAAPRARLAGRLRSPGWLAPLAAAAVIVALAITLVTIKGFSNGPAVPPTTPVPASAVPPRYYVAIAGVPTGWYAYAPLTGQTFFPPDDLVVGDTLTGQQLATIASPKGTAWTGVTAAADDRTFVAYAGITAGGHGTAGSWYLIRLTPGGASPDAVTPLPVEPLSGVAAMALSGSGQQLAVVTAASTTTRRTLGVYSVTTGRLEHEWSTDDPAAFFLGPLIPGLLYPSLTWIDGDQGLTFPVKDRVRSAGAKPGGAVSRATVRRLNLAAANGDLMAESRVIWLEPAPAGQPAACSGTSVAVSASGQSVSCVRLQRLKAARDSGQTWRLSWWTYPVGVAGRPGGPAVLDYARTVTTPKGTVTALPPLWVSASGAALLGLWEAGDPIAPGTVAFGLLTGGNISSLPVPPIVPGLSAADIAW